MKAKANPKDQVNPIRKNLADQLFCVKSCHGPCFQQGYRGCKRRKIGVQGFRGNECSKLKSPILVLLCIFDCVLSLAGQGF